MIFLPMNCTENMGPLMDRPSKKNCISIFLSKYNCDCWKILFKKASPLEDAL